MSCPYLASVKSGPAEPAAAPGTCPFGHGKASSRSGDTTSTTKGDEPAKCPLGFGSPAGPKLSTLHCILCRALLHDPVEITSCQHKYCRFCIEKFRDCPLCGMDITGVEPHNELAGLVGKFIDAHGKDPALLASQVDWDAAALRASLASFYLQIAMQSFAGGNFAAALARLQACEAQLLKEQQQQQEQEVQPDAGTAIAAEPTAEAASKCPSHSSTQQQNGAPSAEPAAEPGPVPAAPVASKCPFGFTRAVSSNGSSKAAAESRPQHDGPAAANSAPALGSEQAAATSGCPPHKQQNGAATTPAAATSTSPDSHPIHTQPASSPAAVAAPTSQPAPAPATPAALACQLGAVCGSQADCHKRLGDLPAAQAKYQQSAAYLAPHAAADQEVAHALSVTTNKLGDLMYVQGDLARALACYQDALEARRRLAEGAVPEQVSERRADLAASHIKVADAHAALGQVEPARRSFEAAGELLAGIGGGGEGGAAAGGTAAKVARYRRLVEEQLAALAVE